MRRDRPRSSVSTRSQCISRLRPTCALPTTGMLFSATQAAMHDAAAGAGVEVDRHRPSDAPRISRPDDRRVERDRLVELRVRPSSSIDLRIRSVLLARRRRGRGAALPSRSGSASERSDASCWLVLRDRRAAVEPGRLRRAERERRRRRCSLPTRPARVRPYPKCTTTMSSAVPGMHPDGNSRVRPCRLDLERPADRESPVRSTECRVRSAVLHADVGDVVPRHLRERLRQLLQPRRCSRSGRRGRSDPDGRRFPCRSLARRRGTDATGQSPCATRRRRCRARRQHTTCPRMKPSCSALRQNESTFANGLSVARRAGSRACAR